MREMKRIPISLYYLLLACAVVLLWGKLDVSAMHQTNLQEKFTFHVYRQS